jgi:hypothetical protein
MFQQQDSRILAIETAMNQFQQTYQSNSQAMDAKVGQIEQTLNQHMTMTSSNLEQLYGEQKTMTQSIATALQRQDDRLAASMDELKSLFLQSRGVKRSNSDAGQNLSDDD